MLYEVITTNNVVFVDSVILNDEGIFSFKGETEIPKFYALRTKANNYITLIVSPYEQIIVKADGENIAENPTISYNFV